MALAERTWERVGERKGDRARLIESADYTMVLLHAQIVSNGQNAENGQSERCCCNRGIASKTWFYFWQ